MIGSNDTRLPHHIALVDGRTQCSRFYDDTSLHRIEHVFGTKWRNPKPALTDRLHQTFTDQTCKRFAQRTDADVVEGLKLRRSQWCSGSVPPPDDVSTKTPIDGFGQRAWLIAAGILTDKGGRAAQS